MTRIVLFALFAAVAPVTVGPLALVPTAGPGPEPAPRLVAPQADSRGSIARSICSGRTSGSTGARTRSRTSSCAPRRPSCSRVRSRAAQLVSARPRACSRSRKKHVDRAGAAVGRARGAEREHAAADAPARQPHLEPLLEHRDALFGAVAAAVDDEHAAPPVGARGDEEALDLDARLVAGVAVQIEVRLDGVVARAQLAEQALVDAGADALDVLVGGADVEDAGAVDQVGERGVGLGLVVEPAARRRGGGAPPPRMRPRGSGGSSTTPRISSANTSSSRGVGDGRRRGGGGDGAGRAVGFVEPRRAPSSTSCRAALRALRTAC